MLVTGMKSAVLSTLLTALVVAPVATVSVIAPAGAAYAKSDSASDKGDTCKGKGKCTGKKWARDKEERGGRGNAKAHANGKRSLSPDWSKRKPKALPPAMVPLPASTFSESELAPETSRRPRTRSS